MGFLGREGGVWERKAQQSGEESLEVHVIGGSAETRYLKKYVGYVLCCDSGFDLRQCLECNRSEKCDSCE